MDDILFQTGLGVLQGVIIIVLSPAVTGLLRFLKARLQGRPRPVSYLWQPYRDLFKLIRKPAVRSKFTSWIFAVTPLLLFGLYGTLAGMLPLFHRGAFVQGDLILMLYLLGLARFVLSLAGLDANAPFSGLGSSREIFLHFLTEMGMGGIIAALMIKWGTLNLYVIAQNQSQMGLSIFFQLDLFSLALALFLLILFEGERIPIDNPATHLELTMAHQAVTLEYAGRDLALIEWAEMTKLTFLLGLWVSLFLPLDFLIRWLIKWLPNWLTEPTWFIGISGLFLLKIIILALGLVLWEMFWPKLRLRAVSSLTLRSIVLSLLAIIYTFAQKAWGD